MASVTKMHTLLNLSSTLWFAQTTLFRQALFALRSVREAGNIMASSVQNAVVASNSSMVCAGKREDGSQSIESHSLRRALSKTLSVHRVNSEKVCSAMINLMKATLRPQVLLGKIAQQTYLMSVGV